MMQIILFQEQMTKQFSEMIEGDDMMEKLADIGRQNLAMFQKSMAAFTAPGQSEPPAPDTQSEPEETEKSEVDQLKQDLAEMQARLDKLSKDN